LERFVAILQAVGNNSCSDISIGNIIKLRSPSASHRRKIYLYIYRKRERERRGKRNKSEEFAGITTCTPDINSTFRRERKKMRAIRKKRDKTREREEKERERGEGERTRSISPGYRRLCFLSRIESASSTHTGAL